MKYIGIHLKKEISSMYNDKHSRVCDNENKEALLSDTWNYVTHPSLKRSDAFILEAWIAYCVFSSERKLNTYSTSYITRKNLVK